MYVNCIRSLYTSRAPASRPDHTSDRENTTLSSSAVTTIPSAVVKAIADELVIRVVVTMLEQSAQYPILSNEAIIGLAVLVTFGPEGTGESDFLGSVIDLI